MTSVSPAALAAFPAPDPDARVDCLAPPVGTPEHPLVVRFDAFVVGDAALLRVVVTPLRGADAPLLIADSGDHIDLLELLPADPAARTLGFTCSRSVLDAQPLFFLRTDEVLVRLPEPTLASHVAELVAA
jgi:hypothetical protein